MKRESLQNAPKIPNYHPFRLLRRVSIWIVLFPARVPKKPMGEGTDLGVVGKGKIVRDETLSPLYTPPKKVFFILFFCP